MKSTPLAKRSSLPGEGILSCGGRAGRPGRRSQQAAAVGQAASMLGRLSRDGGAARPPAPERCLAWRCRGMGRRRTSRRSRAASCRAAGQRPAGPALSSWRYVP